jgi:hypothetical protein
MSHRQRGGFRIIIVLSLYHVNILEVKYQLLLLHIINNKIFCQCNPETLALIAVHTGLIHLAGRILATFKLDKSFLLKYK